MADKVKLRGHHLLCILSYAGNGYAPDFTENMNAIAAHIGAGAAIELITGPDDICAALHKGPNGDYRDADHCFKAELAARDSKALAEVGAVMKRLLKPGDTITLAPDTVAGLRRAFSEGSIRSGCRGCEWHGFCTEIATNGFDGVKLYPHACR